MKKELKVLTLQIDEEHRCIIPCVTTIDGGNTLRELYRLCRCDTIDVVEVEVNDHYYDIICDDNGLLKQNIPTLYINEERIIFGNIVFTRTDEEGATIGLNEDDVLTLLRYVGTQAPLLSAWIASVNAKLEVRE